MFEGLNQTVSSAREGLLFSLVEAGFPFLPLLPIVAFFLVTLMGSPGLKPSDDTSGHAVWVWQFKRLAFAAALVGIGLTICHWVLARQVLTKESLQWMQGELVAIWALPLIVALLLGLALRLFWNRYLVTSFSDWLRAKRVNTTDEQLSDIRAESGEAVKFIPATFYKPDHVFTGIDKFGEPLHVPEKTFLETHKAVIGATRYGKGITFQAWLDQAIRRDDCVFFIDPKGDEWLPRMMRQSCEETGRSFHYIDLNDDGIGSWSPFAGGTAAEKIIRAKEALNLNERGSDADHYKALASSVVSRFFRETNQASTLRSMAANLGGFAKNDEQTGAITSPIAKLSQMSMRRGLNPKGRKGLDIEQAILANDVIYIVGDIDDETIKLATRTIIIEVMQAAKRLGSKRTKPLSLYIDELRFLVSDTVTGALATAAGRGVNLCLAFQNLGDLLNPDDRSLNGSAIQQSVLSNCQVQLFFHPGRDIKTAEHVSENTGTIVKKIAYERTTHTAVGGESWEPGRTMRDVEEALIPVNRILSLQPFVGVLFQPGHLAQICKVAPVPVTDTKRPLIEHKTKVAKSRPQQVPGGQDDDALVVVGD